MFQNRTFLASFFLSFACLAGFALLHLIVQDGDSVSIWIGVIGGIVSGFLLLGYILRSKSQAEKRRQMEIGIETEENNISYVWLFPSVVGGVLLGSIAVNLLGERVLDVFFACLSAWIFISFSSFAYLAWRYMPRN